MTKSERNRWVGTWMDEVYATCHNPLASTAFAQVSNKPTCRSKKLT